MTTHPSHPNHQNEPMKETTMTQKPTTQENPTQPTIPNTRFVEKFLALKDQERTLEQKQKTHQQEVDKFILARLHRLQTVGRSVLGKSYGKHWSALSRDEYMFKYDWVHYNFTLKSFSTVALTLHSKQAEEKKIAKDGLFQVNPDILTMSDRDFAKEIRTAVRARKERLRRLAIQFAEEDLQKTQDQVAELEKQIVSLNKLIAEKHNQQQAEKAKQREKANRAQKHLPAIHA